MLGAGVQQTWQNHFEVSAFGACDKCLSAQYLSGLTRGSFVFPKGISVSLYNDLKRCFEIVLSQNADVKKKKRDGVTERLTPTNSFAS